jgi:hypothetical protein
MMVDTDHGFGKFGHSADYDIMGHTIENSPLFMMLLENEEFQYRFIHTMIELINTVFRPEHVIQRIDEMQSVLYPEILEHANRWNVWENSLQIWEQEVDTMRVFALERPYFQMQHLNDFFGLDEAFSMQLSADHENDISN